MILDITSFGWSGSGAYHDLLREFDGAELPCKGDWEFSLLWDVDGIYDLDNKLCEKCCRLYDSDMALQRFLHRAEVLSREPIMSYLKVFPQGQFFDLCKDYVDKLVKIKFPARSFNDWVYPSKWDCYIQFYNKIVKIVFGNRIMVKIFGEHLVDRLQYYNPHVMLIAYRPDDFLEITQDFIQELLNKVRTDNSKVLVTDQMLPPDNQEMFLKYIHEPLKSIIVRRDPRDTYIAMLESGRFPKPIPTNIDDFIWFYKNIVLKTEVPNNENRMSLYFEDLIYEYDKTIERLRSFVNLGNHVNPRAFFNPDVSKNNTQLFELHSKYKNDIERIEKDIPEALYPFYKYHFERTSTKIF